MSRNPRSEEQRPHIRSNASARLWRGAALALVVILIALPTGSRAEPLDQDSLDPKSLDQEYRATIEADWNVQEKRLGRQPGSVPSIDAAWQRAARLIGNLVAQRAALDLDGARTALDRVHRDIVNAKQLSPEDRLDLYHQLRWIGRDVALCNPLIADRPIVFMQRRRFICQMLHEYIGYYYNYADLAGGGVYLLEEPGRSFRTRDLINGRLPRGAYTTLALSADAKTVYFAFSEVRDKVRNHKLGIDWTILPPADEVPFEFNYFSPERAAFHLFAMRPSGEDLRELTFGCEDDFDPCPLPDGHLVFMSSRRGGFCRCDNPFEPIPTHTLHRLDPSTGQIETLSWHETNEWHPSVLNDGRIIYCRWDYVDRSAANYHGLWISNPNGSNPVSLFGNYTRNVSACYQPRAIPNSNRIVFIAGAHHANVGGSLVLLDPARVSLDPTTGQDRLESLERLTPEVCFPETSEGWPGSFFHSPWPLSEDYYLVAFSFDPLPGMGSGVRRDSETGIYYYDRFGNLELLYREAGICSVGPIPLAPRPAPPQVADLPAVPDTEDGEFMLADVTQSLMPMPTGRPICALRVFQVLPKETTHIANRPRIGVANAESARMMLGTVPVARDGSAYFRAPARKPLYFQAVDADGRAVQTMRSVTYLQPGERHGCVGCHERPGLAAPIKRPLAWRHPPAKIRCGPDGTQPLNYVRLVQPVLDKHCIRCHALSGGVPMHAPVLTGEPAGQFTRSYDNLRHFIRWYEWGDKSITQTVSRPGHCGADESRLLKILSDANHQPHLNMADADLRRLYIWLDANAPFYGTYRRDAQHRQLVGDAVPPPELQ